MGNWRIERVEKTSEREHLVGTKWTRCLSDLVCKMMGGALMGGLITLSMQKKRFWPIYVGIGIGLSKACINCEQELNIILNKPTVNKSR